MAKGTIDSGTSFFRQSFFAASRILIKVSTSAILLLSLYSMATSFQKLSISFQIDFHKFKDFFFEVKKSEFGIFQASDPSFGGSGGGAVGSPVNSVDAAEKEKIITKEKELKEKLAKSAALNLASNQPQTRSMHLLDAHIIFEPLLSSLGLMPQQIQNLSLKNLGSNVSLLANIEEVKVDIGNKNQDFVYLEFGHGKI